MARTVPITEDRIVYEDNHIIVINKLASEIVQGDKTGDIPMSERIKEFLKERDSKPGNVFCGVIHRLDRPVSGLVIFAKTSKALSRFNEMFREKNIHKSYLAVVSNAPPKKHDLLTHYLIKNEKSNTSKAFTHEVKGSLKAQLEYDLIASSDRYFLVKVKLLTGRHHQIRAQLSAIGCPIKGDIKYGSKRTNEGGFIHLHSYSADFIHPVKKEEMHITCLPITDDKLWQHFVSEIKDKNLLK